MYHRDRGSAWNIPRKLLIQWMDSFSLNNWRDIPEIWPIVGAVEDTLWADDPDNNYVTFQGVTFQIMNALMCYCLIAHRGLQQIIPLLSFRCKFTTLGNRSVIQFKSVSWTDRVAMDSAWECYNHNSVIRVTLCALPGYFWIAVKYSASATQHKMFLTVFWDKLSILKTTCVFGSRIL